MHDPTNQATSSVRRRQELLRFRGLVEPQANADALGRWNNGATPPEAQRQWENDGRTDLRSVTNAMRQLPYHIARQRGHRYGRNIKLYV